MPIEPNSRFFRNAAVIGIAEAFARARALVVLPLIAHRFGATGYGVWSQVTMLALLLMPLVLLNSQTGVIRQFSVLDAEKQKQGMSAWLVWLFAAAAVWAVLVLLLRPWFASLFFPGQPELRALVPLAAANIFVGTLPVVARTWFRLRRNAFGMGAIPFGQAMIQILAVAAGIALGRGLYEIVALTILADLVWVGGLLLTALTRAGWRRPDFALLPSVLRFGLPLLPTAYAIWCLNWIDRLFVVHYRGLADVGIYAAAVGIGFVVIQVFATPIFTMYPNVATELYHKDAMTEINAVTRSSGRLSIALVLPSAVALWILGPRVLVLMGGAAFASGSAVIPVITLAYLVLAVANYDMVALGLVYRQHFTSVALALALAVNIALNFALIPRFGIMGAAIATLLAFCVQLAGVRWAAMRYVPGWQGVAFSWEVVLSAALMGAGLFVLDRWIAGMGWAGFVVLVCAGALLSMIAYLMLGVVTITQLRTAIPEMMIRSPRRMEP